MHLDRSAADVTDDLMRYLRQSRDSVVSSLGDLSEYDVRRPLTPSATNLLGLVKHLVGIELGYLGDSVGRPATGSLPWYADGSIWDGADMWATADESTDDLLARYRDAWRHTDASVTELGLAAPASVAWWPEGRRDTTLGSLLVRVVAETAQHAGHADIVRELIDGRGGGDSDEIGDEAYWTGYRAQVQAAADAYRA